MVVYNIEKRILNHVSTIKIKLFINISKYLINRPIRLFYNQHYVMDYCIFKRKNKLNYTTNLPRSPIIHISSRCYSSSEIDKNLMVEDKTGYNLKEKEHPLIDENDRLRRLLEPIINPTIDLGPEVESKDEDIKLIKTKFLLGITPGLDSIKKLIIKKSLEANSQNISNLFELIQLMWEIEAITENRFYIKIIDNLLRNNDDKSVVELLAFLSAKESNLGYPLSFWTFDKAINCGNIELAKACFKFMFHNGYLRNNSQLYGFLRCINLENAQILQHCLNPSQLKRLFIEFTKKNNIDGILNLIALNFNLNIKLDTSYYSIFLRPVINYSPEIGIKLFEHLKHNTNQPIELKLYITFIDAILRKSQDFETAQKTIDQIPTTMKTHTVERTIANILLQAHFRYHDIELCLNYYSEICENPGTDMHTYSILFQRFSHYKKASLDPTYEPNLDRFKKDIINFNITLNSTVYNMMIKCYLKVNYLKSLEILNERISKGFQPDRYTYAMFIIYASKVKKDIPLTLYWFGKMVDAKITPIAEVVTAIMNLIKRAHDIQSAEIVKKLLQKCNFKPSLDDHIDQFIYNVKNNIPPINVKKPKKRWLKVKLN